jgi:hypothetical protein
VNSRVAQKSKILRLARRSAIFATPSTGFKFLRVLAATARRGARDACGLKRAPIAALQGKPASNATRIALLNS